MNFAKLNYVLIPTTKDAREKFKQSRWYAFVRVLFKFYLLFSREGHLVVFCWMILALLSVNIGYAQYYVVWSILSGLLLSSFIARPWANLSGLDIHFEYQSHITVGETIEFTLEFKNSTQHTYQGIRVDKPFLPWDGKYLSDRIFIDSIRAYESKTLTFKAQFVARGEHLLDFCTARALAPFGLATGPALHSNNLKFLVLPTIANVKTIPIDHSQKYHPGGTSHAFLKGESREVIGVRPYRPGDPIRDLHAKTWARIGQPVVREYQQEYFTRFGVIMDIDGGTADEPDFEALISLTAGVVRAFSKEDALLDFLVLGSEIHQFQAKGTHAMVEQSLELLACVEPRSGFSSSEMRRQLEPSMERISNIVFLTLNWNQDKDDFTTWIEQHGIQCRNIFVDHRQRKKPIDQAKWLIHHAKEILNKKELTL